MLVDLHIHSKLSDGKIDIHSAIPLLFSNYSIVSFSDHENIFNPTDFNVVGTTKFISGVEICCNHNGKNIEILGYGFDVHNHEIINVIKTVKELRVSIIRDILSKNGFLSNQLPTNPFRINVSLPQNINAKEFWNKYNEEYKNKCHSVSADKVISAIIDAGGIPVLAHPMESLIGLSPQKVEQFILSLKINTIELLTPKHSLSDINLINDIIARNKFSASIGSDSHHEQLTELSYSYDLNDNKFKWIQNLL